ncbi:hypothetical protein [Emcibacter sp. SYSU 3D8]|uniref:hypothetical protein n=1 Tax=Emcibacter sp. SYSU 3D8 TaxID=3133969 RepID=UPI0031FE9F49
MTAKRNMSQEHRRYLAGRLMQMAGSGRTQGQAGRAMGLTPRVTGLICRQYGIEFLAIGLRRRTEPAPRMAAPELQAAVDVLRRHHAPVCAEATIRRPHMVPRPYTARTLFRVGDQWAVTAGEVIRMAAALDRETA